MSSVGQYRKKNLPPRRCKVPYSDEEENNLVEGVQRLGTKWNQILVTFNFHPIRTAVDLKEKYHRMMVSKTFLLIFINCFSFFFPV